MKKMNFKWLVVLCMTMGISIMAKAQIYSSEECYYERVRQGEGYESFFVVRFDYSNGRAWLLEEYKEAVRHCLAQSESYYLDGVWTDGGRIHPANSWSCGGVRMYVYCENLSTSSREVYKRKNGQGWSFAAFATDKSSIITWYEPGNNYEGTIYNKEYYTKIPKENLLPKAINRDFLND